MSHARIPGNHLHIVGEEHQAHHVVDTAVAAAVAVGDVVALAGALVAVVGRKQFMDYFVRQLPAGCTILQHIKYVY